MRAGDGREAILKEKPIYFDNRWLTGKVYDRARLEPGDRFHGPAVIVEYSATTFLPPGCNLYADEYANLDYRRTAMSETVKPDPIELAIFKSSFHSIAEEMGAALRRTAFSPNIKERRDYSSAVFDEGGRVIAMGDDMPVHLGSMPMSVRAALDSLTLEPGDVAILNDPYDGGTHLPDITLVMPVFVEGKDTAAFYVANRAHHADVGGTYPGSMGLCREIWQEGVRIPPLKLVAGGVLNASLLSLILNNVRTPKEREGDLTAQVGACRIGVQRVIEMVAKYGLNRVQVNVAALLNHSEELMKAELERLPARRIQRGRLSRQ